MLQSNEQLPRSYQMNNPVPKATGLLTLNAASHSTARVGRWQDNDLVLDAPGVSRHHAMFAWNGDEQPMISDLGSTNGTFINGELLKKPGVVTAQDLLSIGGFVLRVRGRDVQWYDLNASRICAANLSKEIAGKTILKDISLVINQREFVGLIGPSGCGKSTLMDALNGLRPATEGSVYINELDLYENFETLRRAIGRVPQRDILIDSLTVERTLQYAAKLRLPENTTPEQRQQTVDEVIATIDLEAQRHTTFAQLSGGQQKRLSLGLELITRPRFIFLDEPTSPLDPQATENVMMLFRKLADEGRIVVMVTHRFEKFELMHKVAILTRGGRLAFFGPPREALQYFGCHEPAEIYRLMDSCDPDQLAATFKASPQYRLYVESPLAETHASVRPTMQAQLNLNRQRSHAERRFGMRQWVALTQRFLETKLNDGRNTALLFIQPLIVGGLMALITPDTSSHPTTLFMAAFIAVWFGANNTIREIVADTPVYQRERAVNLKIPSSVLAKFAVFSGVSLLQCLLFIGLLMTCGRLQWSDGGWVWLILYLTTLGGTAMGLFFSALARSTEKALTILPLLLVPQMLLGGYLKPIDDVYVNLARGGIPATVAEYQASLAALTTALPSATAPAPPPEMITKQEGMGLVRPFANVMLTRWSLDALAHAVSLTDQSARDKLAAVITLTAYEQVQQHKTEEEIATALRQRIALDATILAGFIALLLALTMLVLWRRDLR